MIKYRAIALCRVSSTEQLENNSLNRQRESVKRAAKSLDVTIPDEYWLSGSVSSKRGTNLGRKDLRQAIEWCKKDKRIKYIIVDEPDRFMRSVDEGIYYEVTFRKLNVTVYYASEPELNKGDLTAKLLKFTKYFSAEGSNEERQRKSIAGQAKALQEGRYPFVPKPGYKKGLRSGVHEIEPKRGPALKQILIKLASGLVTPTEALKQLNRSEFMHQMALYKMDKFRRLVIDPYYAGIVEVKQQINVRNENGQHEPLISREQHQAILAIMTKKPKNQSGPRKDGNPKYPCNNIISCDSCDGIKANNRIVGFDHGNGKPNSKVYEKYRCRGCKVYLKRDDVHEQVLSLLHSYQLSVNGREALLCALRSIWKQQEEESKREAMRLQKNIEGLRKSIDNHVEAITDPSNALIKENLMLLIKRKRMEVAELEDRFEAVSGAISEDRDKFLQFAINFIDDLSRRFLELSPTDRLRCKQVLFPKGIRLSKDKKVYTPEVSSLITLGTNKKDLPETEKSFMVRIGGL